MASQTKRIIIALAFALAFVGMLAFSATLDGEDTLNGSDTPPPAEPTAAPKKEIVKVFPEEELTPEKFKKDNRNIKNLRRAKMPFVEKVKKLWEPNTVLTGPGFVSILIDKPIYPASCNDAIASYLDSKFTVENCTHAVMLRATLLPEGSENKRLQEGEGACLFLEFKDRYSKADAEKLKGAKLASVPVEGIEDHYSLSDLKSLWLVCGDREVKDELAGISTTLMMLPNALGSPVLIEP